MKEYNKEEWINEDINPDDALPAGQEAQEEIQEIQSVEHKQSIISQLMKKLIQLIREIVNTILVTGIVIYALFALIEKLTSIKISGSTFILTYTLVVLGIIMKTPNFIMRHLRTLAGTFRRIVQQKKDIN